MSKKPIVPEEASEEDDGVLECWGTYSGTTVIVPRREHKDYAAKSGWWCLGTVPTETA